MLPTIRKLIRQSDAVLITAGAGMGVDSGLPDFRGNEGFWREYPALKKHNIRFEYMANPTWFYKNPALAWGFYGHRYNLYKNTQPHKGFSLLLNLAQSKHLGYFVYTSNVDGHFHKAGFSCDKIVECHGSINYNQCLKSCSASLWENESKHIPVDKASLLAQEPLPVCPFCKGLARPNILMFGDREWNEERSRHQENLFQEWYHNVKKAGANLCVIEIGAGTAVPTIRYVSETIASAQGASLIRINPSDTAVPRGHYSIALGGLEGIQLLLE